MIDTITIMTKKTIVGQENGLTLEYNSSTYNNVTITYDKGNKQYNISKAYSNQSGLYTLDYWRDITFVTFSPAKVLSKDSINYPLITSPKQLEDAFIVVWKAAEQVGIYLPDYTSSSVKISKLHITKDIILDNPFDQYLPCLDTLVSPYKKSNTFKTTRYWQNKQNAICIYDKSKQLEEVYNYLDVADNTVRVEYRIEKTKKIKGLLETNSIPYLLNNWDILNQVFTKEMTRLYEPIINVNIYLDEMEYFKDVYGNKYLNPYFKWKAIQKISVEMTIVEYKTLLKSMGYSRKHISDKMKEFRNYINTIPVGNIHSTLYTEFRTKLLD